MVKEKRSKRSVGVVIAIILAISALLLAGFNTVTLILQGSNGTQPDFQKSLVRVYLNDSYVTDTNQAVRLNFTTKTFDLYSDFDLAADAFIAPKEGYFRFDLNLQISSPSVMILLIMYRDGETYSQETYTTNDMSINFSDIAYLQTGQVVNFTLRFGGDPGTVTGSSAGPRTRLTIEEL